MDKLGGCRCFGHQISLKSQKLRTRDLAKTEKSSRSQKQKFIDKAREIGCEEDEATFEKQLKRIVPKPNREKAKPPKS